MSKRLRSREVCADCSAPEPRWASINRGVLICDECCSIHRGLGRHSSQVRHLTHSSWPPSQLQMVQTLYGNGANSIWEHTLLDPSASVSGKRKANPQDRVHPNKTEFIKAKYQMLAYVHRMPCREDDSVTAKDLSKQLHSSVRTGNLETCLRLLSLGAQANFFHPEKGNTPLHIAAKAGQVLQAELLSVYGADPGALDSCGKTPIDYARQAGHHELAERLVEIQYELTDRLTFYLCGRRPDHRNGTHFIIPQMADSLDLSEFAKAAKKKLQSLSNHQFEELAMDVYDEVDRRETDAVWLATQNHSTLVTDTTVVPFLPVNPEYSSTRNQGRQKLARFSAHEFATLVIDILTDAKHRQWGNTCESPKDNVELILQGINSRHNSESQDNDYDSVASDEDPVQEATCSDSCNDGRTKSSESSDLSDGPITVQEFMEVKSALTASEAKIQQLLKVNCHLSEELRVMQSKLNSLQTENTTLKWQAPSGPQPPQGPFGRQPLRGGRALSMYETGSNLRQYPHRAEPARSDDGVVLQPFQTNGCSLEAQSTVMENDYDPAPNHSELEDAGPLQATDTDPGAEEDGTLPCTEDVICKTEQITKNIQELLRAAQETKHDSFLPCSEKICLAVTEMAALFPKRPSSETVRGSLCLLTSSASRLHGECLKAAEHCPCPSDIQLVTQQVIQCAYDIAKAAKQLVTVTTKENNN
ncbi:ARF GTPase-activating protein GIT2b isoform X2 [Periophthalmus magnuspinnatus]|uniref:ARF GTPase-activating protein GIT2b isoform X2 n=1 Tax=Periophthalmus magnuspinnatus TaxID=409849 RepID=UPI00145A5171|nr:ARF GTPase-activating protein GIT2b isoform X2 [Periophthalmus magnuspinnatus]